MPTRVLLIIFCILFSSFATAQDGSSVNIKKIVIDAGHGGQDPGTVSPDGKYKEKEITLSVALKLGALIKNRYQHIDVIYTRDKDVAVALDRRTEIANKNKADLFISIHVNGVTSRSASGSETFVMGADKSNSNFQVTMLENSVVLLEGDDYQTRYEGFNPNDPESYIIFTLLQNAHLEQSLILASLVQKFFNIGPIKINRGIKQAPFLVLWKTSMPSVLIELGFISNTGDLRSLVDNNSQDKLASLIFKAFEEYKKQYDKGYNNLDYVSPVEIDQKQPQKIEIVLEAEQIKQVTDPKVADNSNSNSSTTVANVHYRIQILSVSKTIPTNSYELKGERDVKYLKTGSLFKYTIGEFQTREQANVALKDVRKKFPQAFIVKVSGKTIIN